MAYDPDDRIYLPDGDPRHGRNGYTNYGCRCDTCRLAVRANHAEWAARAAAAPPDRVHGTYNGYTNYRCRCDDCRRANTEHSRDYVKRMAAVSHDED